MAIEEIHNECGDAESPHVRVTRETQPEHRTEHGRYVPESAIARLARQLITPYEHQAVAKDLGVHQPRVSEAVHGRNLPVALQIIQHYGEGDEIEGPLYYVPDALDTLAWERSQPPEEMNAADAL